MKSTISVTIEHDILVAIRATGANVSEICEQALASHVNWVSNAASFYDVFISEEDDTVKFLNKMVHHIVNTGFPGRTKKWADRIKQDFDISVDPYELFKFAKELVEGD